MGDVISLEAERIKREAKKLMQAENWLDAHQSETQKFLDDHRDEAFGGLRSILGKTPGGMENTIIGWRGDTEDGTRDGV